MAIIKRHKNSISGLSADLLALQAADSAEITARLAGDAVARDAVAAEAIARIAGDDASAAALNAHVVGPFSAAKDLLALVNGDATVPGSFRKAIADLVGGAPVALDTLVEIANYINANPAAGIAAAITAQIEAAKASITGTATVLMDTFGEVEAAVNSEIAARAAAETAMVASLKAYADHAAAAGCGVPVTDTPVVSGDHIVLERPSKNGINGILNFATVRYVDSGGVAFDAPVRMDEADLSGRQLLISVDVPGEWHGKRVTVQYLA